MSWTCYIVECFDSTFYTGIAKDLEKRVACHNSGKGAKYTRSRLPVKLVWYTTCQNKSEALKLEYRIKQLSRQEKIEIINGSRNTSNY